MFTIISKYLTRLQLHFLNDNFSRVLRNITTREKFILDPIFFGFSPMRYSEHVFAPSEEQLEAYFCHFLEKQNISHNLKYIFFSKEILGNHALERRLSLFEHAFKQTWFNNKKKGLKHLKRILPNVEFESWWLHFLLDPSMPKKTLTFRDWIETITIIEKHAQKYPLVHNTLLNGLLEQPFKKEEIDVMLSHLPHVDSKYINVILSSYLKNDEVRKSLQKLLKSNNAETWKVWMKLSQQVRQLIFKDKQEYFSIFDTSIFRDVITGRTLDMNEEILYL